MIDFTLLQEALGPETPPAPPAGDVESPTDAISDELIDAYERERTGPVVQLPPIEDACDFTAVPLPEPETLIKGLIHKGTKAVIGGGSKSFKTWVQMDAAICVAYGREWLGHECVPGKVLFVNFEILPAFFQSRLTKICEVRGIQQVPGRLDVWNLRGFSASYAIIMPKIIERIKEAGYSLIILDPIYKLYGDADENNAKDVANLLNELEKVCVQTGAAILFGAHYSKGNQAAKESIDRISGSGVFARDPDTIIPFTKHEEEESFVVEPILRNLPKCPEFVVTWNYPLMERNDDLDPADLKQSGGRPKVHQNTDLLGLLPEGGLDNAEWEKKASEKLGISRRTFYRLKMELKANDAIIYSRVDDVWIKVNKH